MGVTKLNILCDTHIVPKTTDEERRVTGVLRQILNKLNTKETYLELFTSHLQGRTKLKNVTMLVSSIEKGTKRNSLHFHCVIQIEHSGMFVLTGNDGINITGRATQWVIDNLPWLTPNSVYFREYTTPYVRVNLADSSAENYALKNNDDDPRV